MFLDHRRIAGDGDFPAADLLDQQLLEAEKPGSAGAKLIDHNEPLQAVGDLPVQLDCSNSFDGERRGFAENDLVYQAVDIGGGAGGARLGGGGFGGQFAGASAQGGEASQSGGDGGFIGGRRGWGGGQGRARPEGFCERGGVLAHGVRLRGVEPSPQALGILQGVALGVGGAASEVDGAGAGIVGGAADLDGVGEALAKDGGE